MAVTLRSAVRTAMERERGPAAAGGVGGGAEPFRYAMAPLNGTLKAGILSLSLSLSLALSLSRSLTLSLSVSLSHTLSLTRAVSLSVCPFLGLDLSLTLAHIHTLSLALHADSGVSSRGAKRRQHAVDYRGHPSGYRN